jgi:hypothetical protein
VNPDNQGKYVYKCGASTDGYIDSLDNAVCGKFSGHFFSPTDCSDFNTRGIYGDVADPWECYKVGEIWSYRLSPY